MRKNYESMMISGTKYNILDTLPDGRLEVVEDGRLEYAVRMYAFKLICPHCGKDVYVLDDGKRTSAPCPYCGETVEIDRSAEK